MSPISAAMVNPEHPADPGCGHQQRHVPVVGAQGAQRGLTLGDLAVEEVDQPQGGGHIGGPRLGQLQAVQ
jgi:hypothetical protein